MRTAKRVAVTVAAFAVSLSGMTVIATSAQASASDCPVNRVCLWENENQDGAGGIFIVQDKAPNGRYCDLDLNDNKFSNGHRVSDATSSVYNRTGYNIFLFQNPAPYRFADKAEIFHVAPNKKVDSLKNVTVTHGNYFPGNNGWTYPNVNFSDKTSAVCDA
ncbi:peptidase inhibitor family I36 protein [Micromonospora sp. B9E7]|uniref:peptidase inhibitor family I36 protein n=1 Tax=Micromonospora sp. B9E7 TaxID=3153574 RepID=UPI00325E7186